MSSRGLPSFKLCLLRSAFRRFFEEQLEEKRQAWKGLLGHHIYSLHLQASIYPGIPQITTLL